MRGLADYVLAETLYEGTETRVRRATHGASGEVLVVKQPMLDKPHQRTVGRLFPLLIPCANTKGFRGRSRT